jgi:hypothetical protein
MVLGMGEVRVDIGAIVLVTSMAAALASADGPAKPKEAQLGQDFRLKVGESARLAGEALRIAFEAVTSDSRCPKGEQCIVAGKATLRLSLQRSSPAKEECLLETPTAESEPASCSGYGVTLVGLEPYPVAGHAIAPGDYEAILRVSKQE